MQQKSPQLPTKKICECALPLGIEPGRGLELQLQLLSKVADLDPKRDTIGWIRLVILPGSPIRVSDGGSQLGCYHCTTEDRF
jgi:hypothetical protein